MADNGKPLTIGGVLGESISIYMWHLPLFFIIVLVASSPEIIYTLSQFDSTPKDFLELAKKGQSFDGASILIKVISYILSSFAVGVVTISAFKSMAGKAVDFQTSLSMALAILVPLMITSFIATGIPMALTFGVSIMGAFLGPLGIVVIVAAMIIGIMLIFRWLMAVPACIVEQKGPLESLKRSADLTDGYRWSIFWILFVYAIIYSILAMIIGAIATFISGILAIFVIAAIQVVSVGLFGVIYTSIYTKLRNHKEGDNIEEILKVFD